MALYRSPDYQTSLSQLAFRFKWRSSNIDFQDGGHLGFPIRTILATFDLQVTSILPMKFESIALLVQEKNFKMIFNMAARVTILDFWSEWFELFLIYKSPWYFL